MLLQTEILQKAGINHTDIQQLEKLWNAYQAAVSDQVRKVPHIICTGIYNAGKSTLLNTLCGEEKFPTGDIPTTKAVAQTELNGAVYIDTPGLNAEGSDDQEAQAAYGSADFIIFVSSAQNGGIGEVEAVWLNRLRDYYTADSLKQRMVYVLTHCGQIEPEQIAVIRDKTTADLEKTLGFAPDSIFCVDSVIYQKGIAEDKPLMVEYSALPQLQSHLTGLIKRAGETLRQTREVERDTRQKELIVLLDQCREHCRLQLERALNHQQSDEIDQLFQKANKKLEGIYKGEVSIGDTYVYVSIGTTRIKRMGVMSPFSAEADAKKELNRYYDKCISEARRKLNQCMDTIKKRYCTDGMDSYYFQSCNSINGILEELSLEFQKLRISSKPAKEIHMELNRNDLSYLQQRIQEALSNVCFFDGTGLFNSCYDVFGNRFEVHEITEGHYKKSLFGEKWVSEVGTEIDMYFAMRAAKEQVQEQMSWFQKTATDYINNVLWSFLKSLKSETDECLQEMRKAADACVASVQEATEMPLHEALEHLTTLEKEVSQ